MEIKISPATLVLSLMEKGVAHFFFTKANGKEIREAFATTNPNLVPADKQSALGTSKDLFRYWDLNKQAIRSFKIENVTHILNRLV